MADELAWLRLHVAQISHFPWTVAVFLQPTNCATVAGAVVALDGIARMFTRRPGEGIP
jgi:hypothetical protein